MEVEEQPVLASTWARARRSPCAWAAAEYQLYSSGGSAWAGGRGQRRWRAEGEVEVEVEGGSEGGRRSIGDSNFERGVFRSIVTFSPGRNRSPSDLYFGTEGVLVIMLMFHFFH